LPIFNALRISTSASAGCSEARVKVNFSCSPSFVSLRHAVAGVVRSMMNQMRANMKWIMILTAVTFVGLMVFGWGMDITGRSGSNATGGEIGRVNGEPVTYQEWTLAVRNLQEQQQRGASGPLGAAMQKQVNQELKARGINVSSDEIREAAMYQPPQEFYDNPAFQTDGRFDLNKYHQIMSGPQVDDQLLRQLEAYYREIIP